MRLISYICVLEGKDRESQLAMILSHTAMAMRHLPRDLSHYADSLVGNLQSAWCKNIVRRWKQIGSDWGALAKIDLHGEEVMFTVSAPYSVLTPGEQKPKRKL